MEDALRRAAEHSPQYREALNEIELSGPLRREAWGAFLPDLRLSFGTNQNFRREVTAIDFFGNPLDNPNVQTVASSYSNQGASLGLDLLQGGRRFHMLAQARAQAQVTRRAGETRLNEVLAEVQRQFLSAQRQKARLEVEGQLLAERERGFEAARGRFELASIGRSDLLAAELEVETQRMAVTQARGEYEKGLLALRRAIADPGIDRLDVAAAEPEPFDPADLDIGGLVAMASEQSPRVGEAEAALAVRRAALRASRSDRWPTLSLGASFSRSKYLPDQGALLEFNPEDFSGGLSLSVSIPVFRRFQTSRSIAEADLQVRNTSELIRRTRLEVEEQIRARFVDLETAWAGVRDRARRLEIANERLRIVEEEYRLAIKSVEDLQAAIREQASALRDMTDQRYEFANALVGLYEAAGAVASHAGLSADPEAG